MKKQLKKPTWSSISNPFGKPKVDLVARLLTKPSSVNPAMTSPMSPKQAVRTNPVKNKLTGSINVSAPKGIVKTKKGKSVKKKLV